MQLTPQRREALSSATLTQTLGLMVVFSGVLVVASNATQPAWWLSRGAVRPVQVTTNSGVVTTNYIPNDYMVVTQGQLKQFTARAVEEMNAHLSGGAGTNLNSLVSNWAADYASNGYSATNLKPSDYTAMTAGQLKYIGHLVWTRLVAAGVTNAVPSWLATNALDHQLANLGQVKSVFNFELAAPALTPPQPVTNLTATAGTDEIDLAWTNPGGGSAEGGDSAEGIVIEVSADGGATWSTVTTLDPNADTYAASADPSQSRNYRVTRENSSGSSSSASTTPVTPNSGPPVPRFAVIDLGINIAAYGMNASGAVVGNRYDPANSPTEDDYYSEPIEWSQGQIYPLALPGGVAFQVDDMTWTAVAQPVGISDGGVIVGDPMVGDRLVDPIYWPNKDAGPIDLVSGASFAPFWGDGTNPYQMGIPAYVQSIASDGTVFGSDTSPVSDPCEETVRYLPSFAVLWDAGPESSVIVYGASGHWAADYGSDDGSDFGANIDGVMHPGLFAGAINDSGLAACYDSGLSYEAYLVGPATNVDLGPGIAGALNNATVTVNGHTIPQPQIVGIDFDSDYVPHGLLWDHLNLDGTPAAKYVAKKLDDLLPASSGWSQTYPAAINLGGAIVGTATYTPGPGDPIPAGSHGVLLAPAGIYVDYNRDGKIDPASVPNSADAGKVTHDNPWRFWIDDSAESGDIGGSDIPGTGAPNYLQSGVMGARDLINFFPVYLDIKEIVKILPPESNTYKIKQADGAIDIVLTDLTPDKSGQYLKQSPMSSGSTLDNPSALKNANKLRVTSSGATLTTAWINKIKDQNEGVILVVGRAQTTQPLVLEITNNSTGQVLTQLKLELSIDGIEKMYRNKNLRNFGLVGSPTYNTDIGPPDSTSEPSNYPDKLTDGKNLIFVHGYFVGGQASRGWNAEMFKRFFWSGSKAKFHGIAWFSDPYTTGLAAPQYHDAVVNAFGASQALASYVSGLSGSKLIVAHSLGNMLVSSAIKDRGMSVDQYFLIDAAVAEESYDASITVDNQGLAHPDWIDGSFNPTYSTTLWATEWNQLFSSGDGRQGLTWRNRFAGVTGYNFYSSSEDVLGRFTGNPGLVSAVNVAISSGQYGWNLQEKLKGRRVNVGVAAIGSLYGGWQFNITDPASSSDPLYYQVMRSGYPDAYRAPLAPSSLGFVTSTLLKRIPFFDPGFGEDPLAITPRTGNTANTLGPTWIRDLYDATNGSSTGSTYTRRATLLAQAFPALTDATGANSQDIFASGGSDQRNFDMIGFATTPLGTWPRSSNEWHHNDIKEVGYPYLYKIFDRFVTIGGLNQ